MTALLVLVAALFGASAAKWQRPGLLAVGCFLLAMALIVDAQKSASRHRVRSGFPADRRKLNP